MKGLVRCVLPVLIFVLLSSGCKGGGGGSGGFLGGASSTGTPAENRAPVASIDPVPASLPESMVILDGSRSYDPDGDKLIYAWTQTSGPAVTLGNAAKSSAFFTAPTGTTELSFDLNVADPQGLSSTATVTVSVLPTLPGAAPSSIALITDALKAGMITPEQAIIYKVFSVFGDSRLPAEYAGASSNAGTGVMIELNEIYSSLSVTAQQTLDPFLLPPYAPGSWEELATVDGKLRSAALAPWHTVNTLNGKVKIWYRESLPNGPALAEGVRAAIDGKIWSKIQNLMQKEPLFDGDITSPNGGDGRLDIYLLSSLKDNNFGVAVPYKNGYVDYALRTYILIAANHPLGNETTPGIIQTVAHELMHSWQFSYSVFDYWNTYTWFMEASAMWIEDYIYPDANSENDYAKPYLESISASIDDLFKKREYGEYTIFSYLTNGGKTSPDIIRKAWENSVTTYSLKAVDDSDPLPVMPVPLPRRYYALFEKYWGDVLVANWNHGANGFFFKHDKLTEGATAMIDTPTVIRLNGKTEHVYSLADLNWNNQIALPYLSGEYYHLIFDDDSARTVMFYDGLRSKLSTTLTTDNTTVYLGVPLLPDPAEPMVDPAEGSQWRLIVKIDGEWKEWTSPVGYTTGMVSFCRDAKAERIEELVVVLGNSSIDMNKTVTPPDQAPVVLVSNMGCFGWEGTITATRVDPQLPPRSTLATVEYRRASDVRPDYYPPGLPPGPFMLSRGSFKAEINGQANGCTYSGGDSWTWDMRYSSPLKYPDTTLGMMPEALSGGLYRVFTAHGNASPHEVNYTYTCGGATNTGTVEPTWWYPSVGGVNPAVSNDGTTLEGSSEVGGMRYEWNLKAVREQ